jgi:hypothetical protein
MAAMRAPRLAIAIALFVLVALASVLTYSAYLLVGVLADYLGIARGMAGLLLAILFARVPLAGRGGLRMAGILPKAVRRPLMGSLLALCCLHFLWQGEYGAAGCTGFASAFILTFPWVRRTLFDRMLAPLFQFNGRNRPKSTDDNVIDVEFRERKE